MKRTRRLVGIERPRDWSRVIAAVGLLFAAPCCCANECPSFILYGTHADTPTGPLVRITPDGSVQVAGGPAVAADDVVAIRRQGHAPPHEPHDRPRVLFANGDRLPGRLLSIGEEKARILADLGAPQELIVSLSSVGSVWLSDAASERPADNRRDDAVILSNGDTATGTIIAWPADGPLRLEAEGRTIEIPRERVRALHLSPQLARAAAQRSAYRQVVLANGGRLSVRSLELSGDELRAATFWGAGVRIPLDALAAINVYRGPAVYLSDLTPCHYEHTPYLGVHWPWTADRAVSGGALRLGGGTYDKGVGLHSRARLTFPIPRDASRFESLVGLDEVTGRGGDVEIQVLADGKPLIDQPRELSGTRPPMWLRLPLRSGGRELTLVVDYGRGGDVQDHVNWADARIIVGNAGRK
jgi:hypothetical protein